jgi:hypothetical protein
MTEHPVGEGDPAFDAVVDALIGAFHFPEDHACRVAVVVCETLAQHRPPPAPPVVDGPPDMG